MSVRVLVLLMLILLACSRSTTTNSSGAAPASAGENDEVGRKALAQIEDDVAKALETQDTSVFAHVVAADFHGTQDGAKTFGRHDIIRRVIERTWQYHDLHDEDRVVRIYGNGTVGVVTALQQWTVQGGDSPGQYTGRYTEIFVKRDERWQLVVGHYSDVPPPALPR